MRIRTAPDTVFAPSPLLRCPACDFAFVPSAPDEDLYDEEYFAEYDGEDYRAAESARRFESRRRLDLLDATCGLPRDCSKSARPPASSSTRPVGAATSARAWS